VGRLVGVDARLTSVLVLFFLYLGHIALVRAFDEPERGYRAGAILALVGAVDLPIIKFSVEWWNTLHQPDSITLTGAPTMALSMLWPLFVCALGYTLVFAAIVLARTRAAVMERRIRGLLMAKASRERYPDGRAMTHLPFIAASYALGVLVPLIFGITAFTRMGAARRRLAAIDPRVNRPGQAKATPRARCRMTRKRRRLIVLVACGVGLGTATRWC